MPQPISISLSKFTASVQAAVKAATARNPKFKVPLPNAVTVSYLIRGIPVPEALLSTVTVGETQAFATDIAAHIATVHPEVFSAPAPRTAPEGAIIALGKHLIVGIPPIQTIINLEK